ncbi:MAG: LmbE family protein [Lentisphaerae bacterium GWF2_44_16]|nr:MAG: LmbE family protein [Lentisphaerae bacterium GWF2_44_16]
MTKKAFAIGCHPDDIEFMMAGTLILLKEAGYEIHYMNVANGSCGTNQFDTETIIKMRREEAANAAKSIGAVFHESLVNDLEVFYERDTLFRLGSIVREVAPEIILTHYPSEYMEDHSNTCRLAVSAAFCRGMTNFKVNPPRPVVEQPVTVYHTLPYGLRTPLRKRLRAGVYVDVSSVIDKKTKMLGMHKSQKEWLDSSQGLDSYLIAMKEMCREIGRMSERYDFAEGWMRHLHQGFCDVKADPLSDALKKLSFVDEKYESELG